MRTLLGCLGSTSSNATLSIMARKRDYQSKSSVILQNAMLATGPNNSVAATGNLLVAVAGRPSGLDTSSSDTIAQQVLELWRLHGKEMLQRLHGAFAIAVLDIKDNSAFLAIDRVGIHTMAFASSKEHFVFSDRVDSVAAHPAIEAGIDPQAIFNYIYFFDIPAPGSIYHGIQKLLPGQYVSFKDGQIQRDFYWQLHYRDAPRSDFEQMSQKFHGVLRDSVRRARGGNEVASFLSGGTDSSTVAGVLTEIQGKPARTYSIGFSAEGFDEMEYARLAGRHFGFDMRELYLKPENVLTAMSVIASHYDEPFANESAVPTYFCAKMAHDDGFGVMLAGDGGDEIFGGNTRYAKQKIFEIYQSIPSGLRHLLLDPVARAPLLDKLLPTRKLQSYIRQASIPLPDRTETYNYIYRQPLLEMFNADFLAQVDTQLPSTWLKEVYERTDSQSYINRMMHLDMKFTIADNDLRKVNGMTEAAGIEVRYPLLDDAMVEFSGEVPPDWKVKGYYLRWFFKNALKGFLPDEIINKSKHGFGLPFGIWARDHAPLRERMEDRLSDFKRRGWLQPAYIDKVRQLHHSEHATYYGKMLWVMVMLEEWLEKRDS